MQDTDPNALVNTGLSADQLVMHLEEKQIGRYVIVFDCCRAGAALSSPGVRHRGMINDSNIHHLGGRFPLSKSSSILDHCVILSSLLFRINILKSLKSQ